MSTSTWRRLGRNDKDGITKNTRIRVACVQDRLGRPAYPGRLGYVSGMLPEYPDALQVTLDATKAAQTQIDVLLGTHHLEVEEA